MAGEYAVASEICRRNYFAQITLGRWKRTDILVYNPKTEKELRIEVKTKQGVEWPGQKGIASEGALLVFVDFQNKSETERPDFYILTSDDWKQFIDRYIRSDPKLVSKLDYIDDNYCPVWKDGYVGCSVRPHQILEHKEKWEKLIRKLER
jgi:hypothetical protein